MTSNDSQTVVESESDDLLALHSPFLGADDLCHFAQSMRPRAVRPRDTSSVYFKPKFAPGHFEDFSKLETAPMSAGYP